MWVSKYGLQRHRRAPMQLRTKIIIGTLAAILCGCAKEEQAATQPGNDLSAAEARALAREAYVFGMPLMYYAVNQGVMTNVPKPEGSRAPYNQFAHFREFADPSNRTVVAWNVDTLYSIGRSTSGPSQSFGRCRIPATDGG